MKEILLLLLITISLDGMKSLNWKYSDYKIDEIEIKDLRWPADEATMSRIPDKVLFSFKNAEVNTFPYYFLNQFKNCVRIKFLHGLVKSIHMNPKLIEIALFKTQTENVIIKRVNDYQLKELSCREANLTRIPENIDLLKRLQFLDLSNNLIESVQLDQFDDLDNLDYLKLAHNKIKYIYNHGPISMPSLNHLDLKNNQLQLLDVCNWNMPSLSFLDLSNNNLTHVAINHFRRLGAIGISSNPLNCEWRDSIFKTIHPYYSALAQFYAAQTFCDKKNVDVFGLDCPPSNKQLQQQIYILDSGLSDRFQKIEALLGNLSSKIIEQQNVSNDIVEAMYRMEIERVYSHAKHSP